MQHTHEQEARLIGDIYDAALDPTRWSSVMADIADRTQANTANIIAMDVLNPSYNLLFPHNIPPACLAEYAEQGWNRVDMEILGTALQKYGIGVAHSTGTMYGSIENMRSAFGEYFHFLDKWGMTSQAGALLDHGEYRWSAIGIHRPEQRGFFDEDTLAFLERIAAHLRRALQIHRQLASAKCENNRLYATLDVLVTGVLLLDDSAQVRYANPRAAKLLQRHGTLDVNRGFLQAASAAQDVRLRELIRGAIDTRKRTNSSHVGNHGGVIRLSDSRENNPLMLTVTPLSAGTPWQDSASNDIAAAIFLSDPQDGMHLPEAVLRENYGLTPREIAICAQFINTPAPAAVAERCGLSLETTRTYLKGIYDKTGHRSQADLMRLLMGLRIDFEHIVR